MLKKLRKAAGTYSAYNINVINELFYRYAKRGLIDELPNLFTKLELFNTALHKKITTELNSNAIKVVELASGKKMDRWKTFAKVDKSRKWRVLLTDFDDSLLPNPNTINNADNFKFETQVYSLFDDFPKLKPGNRHDVMLSTYTFDNLWLSYDLHLTKVNDAWYKNLYRLDLSEVEESLADITKGKKLGRHFFKNMRVKTKTKKINIFSLKHGAHIDEYYKDERHVSVNYPGGLIATVVNSFNNQLKKKGIFITADIATVENSKETKSYKSVNGTIKIKIENYALAKYILEKLGFYVKLKNLHEFIRSTTLQASLVKDARIVTPVKIHDHFVLWVKLKS